MKTKLNMTFKKNILFALCLALMAMVSCGTVKDIAYFQNKVVNEPEAIDKHAGIVIQPKDMLSIVVSSRNPELVAMFNLPVVSYQAGSEIVSSGYNQRLMGYVVDNDGNIKFAIPAVDASSGDVWFEEKKTDSVLYNIYIPDDNDTLNDTLTGEN